MTAPRHHWTNRSPPLPSLASLASGSQHRPTPHARVMRPEHRLHDYFERMPMLHGYACESDHVGFDISHRLTRPPSTSSPLGSNAPAARDRRDPSGFAIRPLRVARGSAISGVDRSICRRVDGKQPNSRTISAPIVATASSSSAVSSRMHRTVPAFTVGSSFLGSSSRQGGNDADSRETPSHTRPQWRSMNCARNERTCPRDLPPLGGFCPRGKCYDSHSSLEHGLCAPVAVPIKQEPQEIQPPQLQPATHLPGFVQRQEQQHPQLQHEKSLAPPVKSPSTTGKKKKPRKPRYCRHEGCTKHVVDHGLCIAHGGGKRCHIDGCGCRAQNYGLCWKHGGYLMCTVKGCKKRAKSKGICWSHGGGTKCKIEGCDTIAVSRGLCWAHGGGKRCLLEGCQKPAFRKQSDLCAQHFKEKQQREQQQQDTQQIKDAQDGEHEGDGDGDSEDSEMHFKLREII